MDILHITLFISGLTTVVCLYLLYMKSSNAVPKSKLEGYQEDFAKLLEQAKDVTIETKADLSEELMQLLLKVDNVASNSDTGMRTMRKSIVSDIQQMMDSLV